MRMWKVVQLEKYFDFFLYSHHFSLLSLTSLLSAPEREVTSPSDFKVVGAPINVIIHSLKWLLIYIYVLDVESIYNLIFYLLACISIMDSSNQS